MKKMLLVAVVSLILSTGPAWAADIDGVHPLSGVTGKIIEINEYRINDDVDADTVGLPKKFLVDFQSRTLRPTKDSVIRKTIVFKSVDHIEDMIVLQGVDEGVDGVDDGLAWSLTISRKNGKSVLSASGGGVAYVVFGVCTPMGSAP
ncbi:MAG: hypothetical protein K9L59_17355 [Desulfobacterales bacterium]|nr:hypothetical protein [Desulfobacterales bacterium]MCF8080622.1 hypothetical protein [Desulfobacterales bacterium]